MADWPTASPEVWEDVNQNPNVVELVIRMVEATQDYLVEWNQELELMRDTAADTPIEAVVELADSVQKAAEQLRQFRDEGIEFQMQNLANLVQQTEEAHQEMSEKAEEA